MLNAASVTRALIVLALGGTLLSSSVIAASALIVAILGGVLIQKRTLEQRAWDRPKELRLVHFGFWFFVLTSVVSWALEGFSYEGGKTLGTHTRLILFWPLVIAVTASSVRARTVFTAFTAAAAAVLITMLVEFLTSDMSPSAYFSQRYSPGINAITFGNLALLSAALCAVGAVYFAKQHRRGFGLLMFLIAAGAGLVAMMSQTRSNLIALPVLALLFLPLMPKRWRLPAVAAVALVGILALSTIGQPSFWATVQSNYHLAATKGIIGVVSWLLLLAIPFAVFLRYARHPSPAVSAIAVAGAMVPAGYAVFGLTEATFDRSLFLTFYLVSVATLSAALFNELSASYTRQRQVRVSATVITKNEEDHIADCLQSARQVADEIIVLDSGSTDRTVEIARQYADVVEVTDWPGFGIQKQRALDKATGDWVLSIDADERITPELAREINHTLANPDADAYKLPWAVTLYGSRLDFGRSGRAPLRLFRREGVRFSDALVHEKILIPPGRTVKTLRGRLTHYTHRHFGHALEKSAKYAWLGSQEKYRRGKRTRTLIYPAFRGLLTFVQVYLIRFGFLDGPVGFLVAMTYAQGSFNKYAGLWTLTRLEKQRRDQ